MKFVHGLPLVLLALALVVAGCGGDEPVTPSGQPPTKEAVVALLRDVLATLEAKDYDKAVTYLVKFPGMTEESARQGIAGFLEKDEISAKGIDILAEKGKFGPLGEIYPERGVSWAKKAGVDAAKCHALAYEGAEVAVYWGGDALRLVRLDDVGKL